ncbi:hypothetical protein CLV96_3847 [Leptospira meyeri]|uniref:Uncharacterized protein n=2 Tax=Leptospira TaxID=171 RepID=A0A4R8MK59_LEPME|nr:MULTISPECIES: hypothetical protein [Leptospira]EKJ85844.1 hypothetical protein LEP1GSC017_0386 [Leptospira meyeri serovar Hardjo str. Went 5]TDY66737.1 hypothetical protein CLV96_3847 [Leptospira meyeri]TGK54183.1 hypothetical protein EHQ10_00460 [Leptospira bouyouniensis]
MKALKLYGGIFGSVIILPTSAIVLFGFAMGSMFNQTASISTGLILSALTLLGAFAVPPLTILNVINPNNSQSLSASLIVLAVGVISTISLVYTIIDSGFNKVALVILVSALLILASGYLQITRKE